MPWRSIAAELTQRFEGVNEQRKLNASITRHWLISATTLDRMLGDFVCGMVALEAYFSDNPEITVDFVQQRAGGYISDDTARRRLKFMHKKGALEVRREGRTLYYRLRPNLAEAAIAQIKGVAKPQLAGKSTCGPES